MNQDNIYTEYKGRWFDLTGLGLLKISGPDACKFLQGQLSCDVGAINKANGVMGAHCNPQGRVISLFYASQILNDYYLIMPVDLIPTAISALKKYAAFFKSELQEVTGDYSIIGGLEAENCDNSCAIINLPSDMNRCILLTQPDTTSKKKMATYDEWHMLDMLSGLPSIYPETSAKFLPHDLNLTDLNAVSFDKGCYTGQEIIARMHYRGKPKKHLYQGLSTNILDIGATLLARGNPSGTIIDCSQIMYNGSYPLLFTTDEATVMSQQLHTEQGQLIQHQQSE